MRVLDERAFTPVVHPQAYAEGATLERRFAAAMELMQDWLARNDREASVAHSVSWAEMVKPRIALDPDLSLEYRISGRASVALASRAHVTLDPLTFYFSEVDA